ncbi:glycosyltransferase family 4 protein [Aidingimonas halophila]|uniref:Glycosyltransferase involved in cell wall bisynthesis n=1 Tax=Aidingimonas halophila TaxID=574349 RepID=A0A1H3BVK3_9GAMM|nr:glycosyltransferase family 1 protein [Aidingimonas halophila]GHC27218.1 glycosyl transferase [Aidingimonas halophila]SDX45841.1 Glycosyltransferase involved in cell wall bisynthesis [Aidingimonas halophila]
MRVCLVSETWTPDVNGVAHTLNQLSRVLTQRDVSLQLIRPRPRGETQRADNVQAELQVRPLPLPGYDAVQLGLCRARYIMSFWRQQCPSVVYIATEGPLGWAALHAARRMAIPVVSGFHTNFDRYANDYGVGWLSGSIQAVLRHFHNRTQMTLVPTEAQAAQLRNDGFHHVRVLGRGIDSRHFHPRKRDPVLRHQWGVSETQPVALHVGRLANEKNLDLLVESIHAMQRVQPDLVTVLVGDGPMRKTLQERLPDTVFTGFIDNQELARHYASADIFLFPSCSETYGNVVIEAMASGLGVIAFDDAAAAELIDNDHNGIKIPLGDNADFVTKAVMLCQHPATYSRLGHAARQRVLSRSWTQVANEFLDTLQQVQEVADDASHPCRL